MSKTTTKKKTSAFTSVAAQLLLRRGGREASNGDSIEFFSDLRKCQPELRASGQTERGGSGRPEDGRGLTRRRGSRAGSDELLSSEIGKHDYDWLLTPPASPLRRSAATNASGQQVSTAVPNQPVRAGPASYAKSNSPSQLGRTCQEKENSRLMQLGRTTGHDEKEKATSRLARSSSSAAQSRSMNTPAPTSPFLGGHGHLPRVRTLSSVSVSSITTAGSNASVSSTSLASSPRTPVTARSTVSTASRTCRRRDKATSVKPQATGSAVAARQPWVLSSTKSSSRHLPPTTTSRRAHAATPPSTVSTPRSTTSTTCQQQAPPPTPSKRANASVARSKLASQSSGSTKSTASPSCPTTTTSSQPRRHDVHLTRAARALMESSSPSDGVNTRALSSTTQKWRQSLAPAIAAARNARTELASMDNGSPRNSFRRKIVNADKAAAQRASTTAASTGLPKTRSRPKSANSNNKPINAGRPKHVDKQLATAASRQWSSRSVSTSSTSRLGLLSRTTSNSSASISRSTPSAENGRRVAAARAAGAATIVSRGGPDDAFPSTRYDAMLLREDPRNLTWLQGCDEADEEGLAELVDASLEPFEDAATGLSVEGR